MQAEGFIARRLRVKEKMAVTAIAISFFVIIRVVVIKFLLDFSYFRFKFGKC